MLPLVVLTVIRTVPQPEHVTAGVVPVVDSATKPVSAPDATESNAAGSVTDCAKLAAEAPRASKDKATVGIDRDSDSEKREKLSIGLTPEIGFDTQRLN
jgi:hypothetical protein